LKARGWLLYEPLKESWYRVGEHEQGQRELIVQDPGGYPPRFAEDLGTRPPASRRARIAF